MKSILSLLLLLPFVGFSQTRTIEGKVLAFNKYPLKNIELSAKKSKAKVTTDANGHFSIEIKGKDVIRIKNALFHSYEEKIGNDVDFLKVNLIYEVNDKNNAKAVTKGYFIKSELDYAIQNLAEENNIYGHFNDIYQAIKYAIPEASVVEDNSGRKAFILRGVNSLTGDNTAAYVVNRIVTEDISYITTSEIKKIWKLPTSQLAMYGSQAGNGVICIETF